jgi:hypothetical protein
MEMAGVEDLAEMEVMTGMEAVTDAVRKDRIESNHDKKFIPQ